MNSINGNTVIANPPSDFLYYLTAESFPGCSSKDSISVVVKDCEQELIAPNVFTPNGDNVNDLFFLKVKGAKNFNIHIYNRWGQLLYESTDTKAPWNGKMKSINQNAPDGTYYYIADVEFENNSKTQTFQGFFQLIR